VEKVSSKTSNKLCKEERKAFSAAIKKEGKAKGYSFRDQSLYIQIDDKFYKADYVFIGREILCAVSVKKYNYDEIFWGIMGCEENANEPKSLRAVGAFVSPGTPIADFKLETAPDPAETAQSFIKKIDPYIRDFNAAHADLNHYILHECNDVYYRWEELRLLALIDEGEIQKAAQMAREKVASDKTGGWINRGRTFYGGAMDYCQRILKPQKGPLRSLCQ